MKINKEGYKIIGITGLICLLLGTGIYRLLSSHDNGTLVRCPGRGGLGLSSGSGRKLRSPKAAAGCSARRGKPGVRLIHSAQPTFGGAHGCACRFAYKNGRKFS